jgi:signal transduction histidine kinase
VTLHRVSAAVARGVERDELLRECLQHTMDGLVASRGAVALRAESGALELLAVENLDPDAVQDLVERAVREEAGFLRVPEPFGEAGPCVCAPVFVGDKVFGAVLVERDGDGLPFNDEALELAASVGYLLGLACERDRLQRDVLDKARLAAVGNMLAGVAHDFKNPLTVISAFAELAVGDDDPKSRQETFTTIQRNVGVMTEMVGDLLAFARGDTQLRPAAVNLETLATELEERLRLRCESRKLGLKIVATDADATIDVGRARRIIINLAENAVAALRRGSTIEIVLDKVQDKVAIQVSDDGPGLPAEIRARMFQPFVAAGEGTGLGLAIVRRFVDDHAGRIDVRSVEGQGTTFRIELPELEL